MAANPESPVTLQGIGAGISELMRMQFDDAKSARSRFDKVDASLRELRLEQLHVDVRLDQIDKRIDHIDERLSDVERRPSAESSKQADADRTTPVNGEPGAYSLPLDIARRVVLASIPPPGERDESGRHHLGIQISDSGLHVKTTVEEHQRLLAENRAAMSLAQEFARLSDERDAAIEAADALKQKKWLKGVFGSALKTGIVLVLVGLGGLLGGLLLEQALHARQPIMAAPER